MTKLIGQELIDRLADILLKNVQDDNQLAFEVVEFDTPVGSSITTGDYFTFSSSTTNYYVWFNVDSGGGDPTPGGTPIPVAISSGDSADTVASNTASQMIAVATELTAVTSSTQTVTLVSDSESNVTNLVDVNVGLTNINVTDPDGQFFPNHLGIPTIPRSFDKLLSPDFSKNTIIEILNEQLITTDGLSSTLTTSLNQQFDVLGNFVNSPSLKTNLEKIAPTVLDYIPFAYKELHGPDLDNPVSLSTFVLKDSDFQPDFLDIQVDATLDPGASPTDGDRYVITNAASLHANFGSITVDLDDVATTLADNDIVQYVASTSTFKIAYDVSVRGEGAIAWNRAQTKFYQWDGSTWGEQASNLSFNSPLSLVGDVVSIPQANGSTDGYLSQTDWSTFDGKENALTHNAPISRVGDTISIPQATTSVDGYLSSTDWNTFDGKEDVLTFNSPVSRVGDVVSIPQATSSVDGYLSQTDLTNFDSK